MSDHRYGLAWNENHVQFDHNPFLKWLDTISSVHAERAFNQYTGKVVLLLSGGLDSYTAAAAVLRILNDKNPHEIYALTVQYGQRHIREVNSALAVSKLLKVPEDNHIIMTVDLGKWGGSALTDEDIELATDGIEEGIPASYVPNRNSVLFSLAGSYAESVGANVIVAGQNAVDYSGYPDCRPEFLAHMENAIDTSSKRVDEGGPHFALLTPVVNMTKPEIIELGISCCVDYSATWSCYQGEEEACGVCDSCRIRIEAFQKLGVADPVPYAIDVPWTVVPLQLKDAEPIPPLSGKIGLPPEDIDWDDEVELEGEDDEDEAEDEEFWGADDDDEDEEEAPALV